MDKRIRFHLPWIIWVGAIAFLSFLPGDKIPAIKIDWLSPDTIAHVIMYAVLAFFFLIGFTKKEEKMNLSQKRLYLILILVGILIGYIVELIQGNFIYRRYFDIMDIIANSFGTIFGTLAYLLIGRKLI